MVTGYSIRAMGSTYCHMSSVKNTIKKGEDVGTIMRCFEIEVNNTLRYYDVKFANNKIDSIRELFHDVPLKKGEHEAAEHYIRNFFNPSVTAWAVAGPRFKNVEKPVVKPVVKPEVKEVEKPEFKEVAKAKPEVKPESKTIDLTSHGKARISESKMSIHINPTGRTLTRLQAIADNKPEESKIEQPFGFNVNGVIRSYKVSFETNNHVHDVAEYNYHGETTNQTVEPIQEFINQFFDQEVETEL